MNEGGTESDGLSAAQVHPLTPPAANLRDPAQAEVNADRFALLRGWRRPGRGRGRIAVLRFTVRDSCASVLTESDPRLRPRSVVSPSSVAFPLV